MLKRRRLIPLAVLVVAAVATAAALASSGSTGSSGGRGGTLKLLSKNNPDSLDASHSELEFVYEIGLMTHDHLVGFKRAAGQAGTIVVPDLVSAIPKPTNGGKTWTFRIRKGIRFANGQELKPSDVRYTFERVWRSNSAEPFFKGSGEIVGSAVCDKPKRAKTCNLARGVIANDAAGTVTFHLTSPDSEFLQKLATLWTFITPSGIPEKDMGTRAPPGTGPYMVQSYKPGRSIVLVRNPYFKEWSRAAQPSGYPDRIEYRLGLTEDAEVTAIEHGQADWMYDQPPSDRLNELGTKYAKQVHLSAQFATYWMDMNLSTPPFNDLRVRRALNYATDRGAIVKIWGGPALARPTCQVLPPSFPGYKPYCPYSKGGGGTRWVAPDMAKARKLIAASGTAGMKIRVWSESTTVAKNTGLYFVSLLNQLGYKATLKTLNTGVYFNVVGNSKNKVQFNYDDWIADYPAASDFINTLLSCKAFIPNSSSNYNYPQFCDKSVDGQIAKALKLALTNQEAANALWARIDRQITDKAPWLPLVNPAQIDFLSKRVKNYVHSAQDKMLIDQLQVQ